MQHRRARRSHALAAVVMASLLLVTGCTGDQPESGPPARSVGPAPTLEAKPAPYQLSLRTTPRDALGKKRAANVERRLGRVVSDYLDAAFLAGDYPRRGGFAPAFEHFTTGLARQARRDRELLTNAGSAQATELVVPLVKRARIRALARGPVSGATAHVRLVFREERTDGSARRVTVHGRLLLTRTRGTTWKIFGYDLARDARPAKGA